MQFLSQLLNVILIAFKLQFKIRLCEVRTAFSAILLRFVAAISQGFDLARNSSRLSRKKIRIVAVTQIAYVNRLVKIVSPKEGLRFRIIALTFSCSRNERLRAVALTYNECMLKMESYAVAPVTNTGLANYAAS